MSTTNPEFETNTELDTLPDPACGHEPGDGPPAIRDGAHARQALLEKINQAITDGELCELPGYDLSGYMPAGNTMLVTEAHNYLVRLAISPTDSDTLPDFATLFGPDTEPGQDLTPATASVLYCCALDIVNQALHNPDDYIDLLLPPVAVQYARNNPHWYGAFIATIRDTAHLLAAGFVPAPACTAEELALHTLLWNAESELDYLSETFSAKQLRNGMGVFPLWVNLHPEFAVAGADIPTPRTIPTATLQTIQRKGKSLINKALQNIHQAQDYLFEDHDVLMLFDPQFDGIESNETIIDQMGLANLHPKDWFRPFRDNQPTLAHGGPLAVLYALISHAEHLNLA